MYRANFLWVFAGAGCIVLLVKLTRFIPGEGYYFTFSEILYGLAPSASFAAIAFKFGIPLFVGIPIGALSRDNPRGEAALAGFLAALLGLWPIVLYPDMHFPTVLKTQLAGVVLAYILYLVSYMAIGLVGSHIGLIARQLLGLAIVQQQSRNLLSNVLNWRETIKPVILGLVSSALFYLILKTWLD